jgi:hypothetical protein
MFCFNLHKPYIDTTINAHKALSSANDLIKIQDKIIEELKEKLLIERIHSSGHMLINDDGCQCNMARYMRNKK